MKSTLVMTVALLASSWAGWGIELSPSELAAVAQQTRPAIVQLIVTDRSGLEIAVGNGFYVAGDGRLVTSLRLIEKARHVVAVTVSNEQLAVEGVLATDSKNDLALLKVAVSRQPFLTLADAGQIHPGLPVAIISSPRAAAPLPVTGRVYMERKLFADLRRIQIRAPIHSSAGGAPVTDATGAVIGVVRALVGDPRLYNLAIPVEAVAKLLAGARSQTTTFLPQHKSGDLTQGDLFLTDEWSRVEVAWELEEWAELLEAAEALAHRFPGYAEAYACVGTASVALKRYDRATVAYQHVIQLEPDNPVAWINLGNVFSLQGRDDDAVGVFRKIVKTRPNFLVAWTKLGEIYCRQGKFSDAIIVWRQAGELAADDPAIWANLGVSYEGQGKLSDAALAYQRAVQLEPKYPFAWMRLGVIEGQLGHHDAARTAQRHGLELKPDFPPIWLSLDIGSIVRSNASSSATSGELRQSGGATASQSGR